MQILYYNELDTQIAKPHRSGPRPRAPLGLALVMTLLVTACGGGGSSAPGPDGGSGNGGGALEHPWQTLDVQLPFTALADTQELRNPLRGYYRWRGQEKVPQTLPALDTYQRYEWRDLETAPGVYDFSDLVEGVQAAAQSGRKAAFRLRMMVGYDDGEIYLPGYLVDHPDCAHGCGWWADYDGDDPDLTFVPDWNDPFLQERAALLLQALATALAPHANDIAWIDVGLYGQYGEWVVSSAIDYANAPSGIVAATDASKRAFARMHFEAFPSQQLVMFALYGNYDALLYALQEQTQTALPVGLRIDCLGRASFMNQWINRPSSYTLIQDRWQTAPFVAEFCTFSDTRPDGVQSPQDALAQIAEFHISAVGNGNLGVDWEDFSAAEQEALLSIGQAGYRYVIDSANLTLSTTGELSIAAVIDNRGNAPTYEPWAVSVEVSATGGALAWQTTLTGDLATVTGGEGAGATTFGATGTLPSNLPAGTYELHLVARDAREGGTRAPLHWAIEEATSDGRVSLATLRRD